VDVGYALHCCTRGAAPAGRPDAGWGEQIGREGSTRQPAPFLAVLVLRDYWGCALNDAWGAIVAASLGPHGAGQQDLHHAGSQADSRVGTLQ
jgi:hypothetical protein